MFGDRLRILREGKGLTQSELANRVGVSRSLYNKYEKVSTNPSPETLMALAKELETTTDYLLSGESAPKKEAAPFLEQLPEDRREFLEEIMNLIDIVTMYNKSIKDLFINAYRFEVVTGLRPGEVVGLHWKDIQGHTVNLKRSINIHNEQTRGKNDNARRTFLLTQLAQGVLQDQRELLEEQGIESKYIFPNKDGEHLAQSTYAKRWARYRTEHGLSETSLYELRHTFVSMVKQLPEGLVKPIVGHSKDMDTYSTYGHQVTGEMQSTAQRINNIISGYIK